MEPGLAPGQDVQHDADGRRSGDRAHRSRADARAELRASRARLVQASDTERRRLERNLHDGAQQRLVTVALHLQLVRRRLETGHADVPTAVAGIYGMNFKYMPELEWTLGYPLALGLMGSVCGFLYWKFKKAKWL